MMASPSDHGYSSESGGHVYWPSLVRNTHPRHVLVGTTQAGEKRGDFHPYFAADAGLRSTTS